ncbi:MAG: glycerophosphodiester phosphodiesterase [Actinomycetota bacterium]
MELLRGERPWLVGHRGAAALARENTLAAIEAGARAGVDGVELDVLRARGGTLVLAHGPDLPPDAEPLAAGLALAAELGLFVQLDVKQRGIEADVVNALRAAGLLDRSFVSSFSLPSLATFAALCPELPRSFTYPEDRFGVSGNVLLRPLVRPGLATMRSLLPRRLPRWLAAVEASAATLNWAVVTRAAVEACHRRGIAVYVWTVNDPALAKSLVETGADAIITDDPGGSSSS